MKNKNSYITMILKATTALICIVSVLTCGQSQTEDVVYKAKVYYVELKAGQEIAAAPVMQFNGVSRGEKPIIISVYPRLKFQAMEGIGGAFNEIGGAALMALSEAQRNEVMKNLFTEAELDLAISALQLEPVILELMPIVTVKFSEIIKWSIFLLKGSEVQCCPIFNLRTHTIRI